MVILKDERDVFLITVESTSCPSQAGPIGLKETLEILQGIYNKGDAIILLNKSGDFPAAKDEEDRDTNTEQPDPTNAIYIADFNLNEETGQCTILVNRGNPNATNPAFANPQTKEVRVAKPKDGESIGYSAHILIGFGEKYLIYERGSAVLERMPHVSRTIVFRFLNRLLQRYASEHPEEFEYQTRVRENKKFRPTLKEAAKINHTLKKDLEQGYVSFMELIKLNATYEGLDENVKVTSTTKRFRIKLKDTKGWSGVFPFLENFQRLGRQKNYDHIQIHVRGLPGDRSVSPRFSIDQENAADELYSHAITLNNFSNSLQQCYKNICEELKGKMIGILNIKEHWK